MERSKRVKGTRFRDRELGLLDESRCSIFEPMIEIDRGILLELDVGDTVEKRRLLSRGCKAEGKVEGTSRDGRCSKNEKGAKDESERLMEKPESRTLSVR